MFFALRRALPGRWRLSAAVEGVGETFQSDKSRSAQPGSNSEDTEWIRKHEGQSASEVN